MLLVTIIQYACRNQTFPQCLLQILQTVKIIGSIRLTRLNLKSVQVSLWHYLQHIYFMLTLIAVEIQICSLATIVEMLTSCPIGVVL